MQRILRKNNCLRNHHRVLSERSYLWAGLKLARFALWKMSLSKANPLEERFEGKGYLRDVAQWVLFSACKSKGNQLSKQLPFWNGFLYSFLNMYSSLSLYWCVQPTNLRLQEVICPPGFSQLLPGKGWGSSPSCFYLFTNKIFFKKVLGEGGNGAYKQPLVSYSHLLFPKFRYPDLTNTENCLSPSRASVTLLGVLVGLWLQCVLPVGLPRLSDFAASRGICPPGKPSEGSTLGVSCLEQDPGAVLLYFSHLRCCLMQLFLWPHWHARHCFSYFLASPITRTGLWPLQAPWDKEQVSIFGRQRQPGRQNNENGICVYRDKQAFS